LAGFGFLSLFRCPVVALQLLFKLLTLRCCSFVNFTDPPEIIKKPQNQGVRVGGVASFYCAARGDPPPSIVWRKNGKKVSGKL